MITIRKAQHRGRTKIDWLDSWHTFSFGQYQDRDHVQFGPLRVINDDIIAGGGGFGEHPHREMEIITWVLSGALRHADSLGTGSVIRPGDAQRMSAGRGIHHSEFNDSKTDPVHLLQIWIHPSPEHQGIEPGYEQKHFDDADYRNQLRRIAGPVGEASGGDASGGGSGALTIHQDASVYVARLDAGASVAHEPAPGRRVWLHVARGSVTLNDQALAPGDGAAITDESSLTIAATQDAEVLVFDLP